MEQIRRIFNGKVVTPFGVVENGTVVIQGNSIIGIEQGLTFSPTSDDIDANGMWVLPGLIDMHSDAIEQEIQPRPTSIMPMESAYYELERKLAGHGITTMFHSLSMYYTEDKGNWVRRNPNVKSIIEKINELKKEKHLIRNKVHLRYEMRNVEGYSIVEEMLRSRQIDLVSFMDHTPGKGQWHDVEIQKKKIMKKMNFTSEEADQHIRELQEDANLDFESIKELAYLANEMNISIASHDDDSIEKIDFLEDWKASISEFPISLEVAREAKRRGFYVVVGSPNLLLGGSHNNNLSSFLAIQDGVVDILCSDYYPGSLLQGIFYLHDRGFAIEEVCNLATLNPARALGLDKELGSIEAGKKADLLLVDTNNGSPELHKTMVDGKVVYQVEYHQMREKVVLG